MFGTLAALGIMAGAQAAVGAAQGLGSSAMQYKYNKDLMDLQNQYAIDAFNRQNERQDYLLSHMGEITRQSMANAGYSAADPDGSGMMTPQQSSINPPSNPSMGAVDLGKLDLLQARLIEAQAENIESDTQKKVAETEGQEIQNYLNSTYGAKQFESAISLLDAQTKNQVSQSLYTDQKKVNELNLTEAEIKNINERLQMDWEKLDPSIQLICAQVELAHQQSTLPKAEVAKMYQDIRESVQRISNLQKEGVLTEAQTGVALKLAENYAKQGNILGYETTSAKARAQLDQFERDVKTSMGVTYYQAKGVVDAVFPLGVVGAMLGRSFSLGK